MTLEVKMFEPNTDDLLNTNYADANLQEKDGHTHQDSAVPICILGTYVPDLKTKCMTLIQSMISEAGYTMGVSPKNSSKLSKDILEAVHKFSLLKPVRPAREPCSLRNEFSC
jgi:hypothetical protein